MSMALALAGLPHWMDFMVAGATAMAAWTDYRTGKIYNWLTLPVLAFGLAMAAVHGSAIFAQAAAGVGVAALIFIPLFALGIMGGGDAKLMMALGGVLGVSNTLDLTLVSFAIASICGVVLMARQKRIKIFGREIFLFLRSLVVRGLETHWPKLSRETKTPFGIAIFLGWLMLFLAKTVHQ